MHQKKHFLVFKLVLLILKRTKIKSNIFSWHAQLMTIMNSISKYHQSFHLLSSISLYPFLKEDNAPKEDVRKQVLIKFFSKLPTHCLHSKSTKERVTDLLVELVRLTMCKHVHLRLSDLPFQLPGKTFVLLLLSVALDFEKLKVSTTNSSSLSKSSLYANLSSSGRTRVNNQFILDASTAFGDKQTTIESTKIVTMPRIFDYAYSSETTTSAAFQSGFKVQR